MMRTLCRIKSLLLGAILLEHALLIGSSDMPASAQNRSPGQEQQLPGSEILVAGAGRVADVTSPAEITIDLGNEALALNAKLELLLSPVAVSPNEPYFVVVSVKAPSGEKRLGTVSFFPPRAGEIQSFYFDASPILTEAKANGTSRIDLSVAVVPASQGEKIKGSSVRVVGARLV
jgi:hypothetical protein